MRKKLQKRLLKWYEREGRKHLPWRMDADPYEILVAEILLRKTRVDQALPAHKRIIRRFPSPKALAGASQRRLEDLVSPIGLISRARQLKEIGQKIMKDHGGRVPADHASLQELPGVGRYTASSVLAFGHGKKTPIVDGNISRVYSRVFGRSREDDPSRDEEMWQLAEEMLPDGMVKEYNAALLDFGALVCTHYSPECDQCFLGDLCCYNREQGATSEGSGTPF